MDTYAALTCHSAVAVLARRLRYLRALYLFNNQFGSDNRNRLHLLEERSMLYGKGKLRAELKALKAEVSLARERFGSKRTNEEVLAFLETYEGTSAEMPTLSKYEIDRYWFSRFGGGYPKWNEYPSHLRVALDLTGTTVGRFHYYLPEESLYTDMCIAFNKASATADSIHGGDRSAALEHALYLRSALLSAYYFVEAYLNGVAFDHVCRNEQLDEKVRDCMLEWDSAKGRQKFRSTEWKIDHYPHLILGSATAPESISKSSERQIMLKEGKEWRDSIVHHSPHYDSASGITTKVERFMGIRLPIVARVVDASIGLVSIINNALGTNGINVTKFVARSTTGLFVLEG